MKKQLAEFRKSSFHCTWEGGIPYEFATKCFAASKAFAVRCAVAPLNLFLRARASVVIREDLVAVQGMLGC